MPIFPVLIPDNGAWSVNVPYTPFTFPQDNAEGMFLNFYGPDYLILKFGSVAAIHPISFNLATGVPPGMSLSSSGVLSGTPTTLGTYGPSVELDTAPNMIDPPGGSLALSWPEFLGWLTIVAPNQGARYRPIF